MVTTEKDEIPQSDKRILGVLVIHGMGTQKDTYADKMTAELKERLGDKQKHVAWKSVYWAEILSKRQQEYLTNAAKNKELDWIWARRFVVSALSDAASYRRIKPDDLNDPQTTYGKIHSKVHEALKNLGNEVQNGGGLVVLAHSLGGHIISNYIWDVQQKNVCPKIGTISYEGAGSLRLLVTFGCNIPLFTFALDKVEPINLKNGVKWHNYYDRDDVLGYPLQPINDDYKKICEDKEINVGDFFTSWNVFSHAKYWTDNDFTKPVAESISQVVDNELAKFPQIP